MFTVLETMSPKSESSVSPAALGVELRTVLLPGSAQPSHFPGESELNYF